MEATIDAERSILGAILLDSTTYWQASEELTVDDFFLETHQAIYRAMAEINEGKPVDIVTIAEWLKTKNRSQDIAYVAGLTDGLPRRINIKRYVEIVKDHSRRRQYVLSLKMAYEKAKTEIDTPLSQLVAEHDKDILEIASKTAKRQPQKMVDLVDVFYENIEKMKGSATSEKTIGYPTGFGPLDELLTGYRKREMTIISGWTSHGKSLLMKQGVMANIAAGTPQMVFTKEVSWEQFVMNIIATACRIPPEHARDPRLMNLTERAYFYEIKNRAKKWPLWIDDARNLHINEVCARGRKLVRVDGVKLGWLDYMGLVEGSGKTPTERATSVCTGLWNLGDTEDIPMVVLCQLSRDEKKEEVVPRIQYLKDASIIEQAAHTILFVWREKDKSGNFVNEGKDRIAVAKQRNGKIGSLPIKLNEDLLIFEEGKFS